MDQTKSNQTKPPKISSITKPGSFLNFNRKLLLNQALLLGEKTNKPTKNPKNTP